MADAFVARQPIFDNQKKIFGYELLFRDEPTLPALPVDGDTATSTVLGNSMLAIGLEKLVHGKKAFINFTQNLLIQKVPFLLPKEKTVIEILETVEPSSDVIQICRELADDGYIIALDDFVYQPKLLPFLELASIVKFDIRQTSFTDIECVLKNFPPRDDRILLAEKVETHQEYHIARQMGFDLFQGFFFREPELVHGKAIARSHLSEMQIVSEVHKSDLSFDKLERIIAPDVGLSYKLLRYINSAFFAKSNKISSIRQALVYLGESEIRRFISLVVLSDLARKKSDELIRSSCIRAKFLESLAEVAPMPAEGPVLFTLGIFSHIDAILDQPMDKVMKQLPLALIIRTALAERKGDLIGYLALIEYYEKAQWYLVCNLSAALKIDAELLPQLYWQACLYANILNEFD